MSDNNAAPKFPQYQRLARPHQLSVKTKLSQAVGAIPETVIGFVFGTFVLLFYNQILGVDARLISAALGLALLMDAITDPLVATF
ncbi:MAG: GPH family glycoside/pentoside/hexuronide:cation symporter [Porticoccaceae bacterium]|jgi:GPH family glycoside/pentoside/hexuronide:cation symporter